MWYIPGQEILSIDEGTQSRRWQRIFVFHEVGPTWARQCWLCRPHLVCSRAPFFDPPAVNMNRPRIGTRRLVPLRPDHGCVNDRMVVSHLSRSWYPFAQFIWLTIYQGSFVHSPSLLAFVRARNKKCSSRSLSLKLWSALNPAPVVSPFRTKPSETKPYARFAHVSPASALPPQVPRSRSFTFVSEALFDGPPPLIPFVVVCGH